MTWEFHFHHVSTIAAHTIAYLNHQRSTVNHHEYVGNAFGREPWSSSLQTGHHILGSGSAATIGHGGSSTTRGWSTSLAVALGAHGGCLGRDWEEMESAGKKKKKRGFAFWTLNKLYGLGSINNWGIWFVLAPVFCHPRPNMQVFCFGSPQSRHMLVFGTDFLSTKAYKCVLLGVFSEPRHKSCLELQKYHRGI